MNGLLKGMNVMVTGSSKGIGRGIATEAARQGGNVVICGSSHRPDVDEVADEIRALGREAWVAAGDLSTREGWQTMWQEAVDAAGAIHGLVNNAGNAFDVPFLDMTEEHWDKTYNLNVKSNFFLTKLFTEHCIDQRRGGKVVLVTSVNGFQAERWSPAYDSSKGAQLQLIRSLGCSLAEYGINVNGLAPGMIYSHITTTGILKDPFNVRFYDHHIPLGRVGTPEDCAGAAVFLLSRLADYITGETITVDGGLTAEQLPPPYKSE
jgi:glucose 1-dehydrogenase